MSGSISCLLRFLTEILSQIEDLCRTAPKLRHLGSRWRLRYQPPFSCCPGRESIVLRRFEKTLFHPRFVFLPNSGECTLSAPSHAALSRRVLPRRPQLFTGPMSARLP